MGSFIYTHPNMTIPEDTKEYAINASNQRYWEPPVQRYVGELQAGKEGPRERDFNMRWVASMVADAPHPHPRRHLHVPDGQQDEGQGGKLRLMYEANPMAMIVEAAGGAAPRPRAHPRHPADQAAPACAGGARLEERGRARRPLPSRGDDGPAVARLVALAAWPSCWHGLVLRLRRCCPAPGGSAGGGVTSRRLRAAALPRSIWFHRQRRWRTR
jgi:hypothetical protein